MIRLTEPPEASVVPAWAVFSSDLLIYIFIYTYNNNTLLSPSLLRSPRPRGVKGSYTAKQTSTSTLLLPTMQSSAHRAASLRSITAEIKPAQTYWMELDVNASHSSYLCDDSATLHLLTAITFLYGLSECVIGASLKVWDGFQLYYFKLFITVFIREWLSLHYIIGLCKAGNNWLLGSECVCVCVWG